MTLPIVVVHTGNQPFLKTCLKQAKKYNERVVLLGTEHYDFCECYDLQPYNEGISEFNKVYKVRSTNGINYEKFCFFRWFFIRNFMREMKIEEVFAIDSDVLLYDNMEEIMKKRNPDKLPTMNLLQEQEPYQMNASLGNNHITIDFIEKFIEFLMKNQNHLEVVNKWEHHKQNKKKGGIADMTYFYLYSTMFPVVNLAEPKEDGTFNSNIRLAHNYKKNEFQTEIVDKLEIKFIRFENEKPMSWRNKSEPLKTKFYNLHFQGESKRLMERFSTL